MNKYTSRFGLELAIPVAASMGVITYLSIINSTWLLLLVPIVFIAYFLYLYSSTNYTIQNHSLRVRCGFLVNETIDIDKITEIKNVIDLQSVPALSVRRLLIKSPELEEMAISPKNEKKFINDLLAINPEIKITRSLSFNRPTD